MEVTHAYLPVTSNWRLFYDKNEKKVADKKNNLAKKLVQCVQQLIENLNSNSSG